MKNMRPFAPRGDMSFMYFSVYCCVVMQSRWEIAAAFAAFAADADFLLINEINDIIAMRS